MKMSSERSISAEPLRRSRSHSSVIVINDKDSNVRNGRQQTSSSGQKRRRESSHRTPPSPRSAGSRSASRSSVEGSKSPVARANPINHRSPSPVQQSSSTKKRSRRKSSEADAGRHTCSICSCDVDAKKRLFGVLDNCDHVFCYECIVSWKRSKYSNAESESCPVCKVRSAFITPSKHWYENADEKSRIIRKHKNHLKTLPCRYYLRHGFCRYSDRCFYDHEEAAKQYRQQNNHSRDRDRHGERDRGERDRGERDRGDRGDRGDRDRGDRDRGDRDRGDRERGDRERHGERDRDRHRGSHNGGRPQYHTPSPPPPPSSSRHSSSRYRERGH